MSEKVTSAFNLDKRPTYQELMEAEMPGRDSVSDFLETAPEPTKKELEEMRDSAFYDEVMARTLGQCNYIGYIGSIQRECSKTATEVRIYQEDDPEVDTEVYLCEFHAQDFDSAVSEGQI